MGEVTMNEADNEQLQARSALYRLLALGFSYPEPELHQFWRDGSFVRELGNAIDRAVPEGLAVFQAEIAPELRMEMDYTEFEALYLSAFEMDLPKRSVSMYEGSYVLRGGKSELLLELKGFYDNFGLAVSEELHELEDKLTAELEFMQFLVMKQAQEGIDHTPYIMAQRDFLERHLVPWMPHLQNEVRKRKIAPFYIALVDLTAGVVSVDLEQIKQIDPRTETLAAQL